MERWKDIPNYEGIYQASNCGRIRTHKDKTTYTEKHGIRKWKQRILKYKSKSVNPGYRVSIWKNGKFKDYLVARLVATTFLENLINTNMTVNHKDGNRLNNNINNLEWLSLADNIRHGFETGLYTCQKPIKLINKQTQEEFYFRNISLCNKFLDKNSNYINYKRKRNQFENKEWKWELIKRRIK